MAYENFTSFTEYDPYNELDVVSGTEVSVVSLNRNHQCRLYKDYGENYFDDFELQFDSIVTDIWAPVAGRQSGAMVIMGLYNVDFCPGTSASIDYNGFECRWFNPDADWTNLDIQLGCTHTGSSDSWTAPILNTRYYFTFTRTDSEVTLKIYADAGRSDLSDTLVITASSHQYRYLTLGAWYSTSALRTELSGDVKNLEIMSGGETPPGDPSSTNAEDYTAFTEVDTGNRVEIESSTLVKGRPINRNKDTYIYRNYGVDYFGDIKHYVNSTVTNITYSTFYPSATCIWALTNDASTSANKATGDRISSSVLFDSTPNGGKLYLYSAGGVADNDNYSEMILGYTYYMTYQRSDGTLLTCKIYEDDSRATLLDTLSVSCVTTTFQYVYALSNHWSSSAVMHRMYIEVEYLKFMELKTPDDPGTGGPTDYASNAEWPTSDLYVTIPGNQSIVTVYYYTSGGTLIGSVTGAGGQTVSVPWDGLNCEEEYGWYVVMDNGESQVTSTTWYFTCNVCDIFTIASESHPTIHLMPPRFRDGERWQLGKEIQRFGFYSDNWAIHDNGVTKEPMTLIGYERIDDNGDIDIFHKKFTNIHDIMNSHEEIAITGLGECLDAYYYIKNFRFRTIKGAPRVREWRLELEFSREKTW